MLLPNVALGLLQLVISVVFAVVALYIGFAVMNRFPHNIYVEKELATGNIAVGIIVAAVFVAIALVVESGVTGLAIGISKALSIGIFTGDGLLVVGISFVQLIIGVILAVASIYLALNIFERLTKSVEEFNELKKGNVAVALELAGVIIAVAVVVQSGVLGITSALA